ncbi:MAG: DUF5103 domain-containing protein [Balneolaceae bacterium]|nr:DUF5103 domain-containing protein [Balneolaceae bacterium]
MCWTETGGRATGLAGRSALPALLAVLTFLALTRCVPLRGGGSDEGTAGSGHTNSSNAHAWQGPAGLAPYAPAFLVAPPGDIASLRLHPADRPSHPPVVRLGTDDALILSFDRLGGGSERFHLRLTHRNRDWERSTLSPYEYVDGFHEAFAGGGRTSTGGPPSYVHHRMVIGSGGPLGTFRASGNYLLEVSEAGGGELLFSLPLLVTEDEGELTAATERLFTSATRGNLRATLPLSDYRYPDGISFPQFDLHAVWVPDLLWGRRTGAGVQDRTAPNAVRFRQEREAAWPDNYFRRRLDLRLDGGFGAGNPQIRQVRRDTVPRRVTLERDLQSFPRTSPSGDPGRSLDEGPSSDRAADYLQVDFSLEPGGKEWRLGKTSASTPAEVTLFVAGDFNGWRLEPRHRMRWDAGEGLWRGSALVKEGAWHYAYLLRGPEGDVRSVGPLPSTGEAPHEILALVYYTDPVRGHDRLLQAKLNR